MGEFVQNSEITLAAASGSAPAQGTGLGKITTLVAAATDYIRLDCDRDVAKVDWVVKANKSHSVQLYRARTNVLGATITLADATAVDDGDTFILNGLTFTAETTDGDASAAARKWYHPNQADGAVNLAALLSHATYGVPGIGAISVAAVDATDVLTIAAGRAFVYQFNQGTSASNEIAWAQTTLASLVTHGSAMSSGLNSTTAGSTYEQWCDGWPYCYLGITNNDATNPMTYSVKATRYWS